MMLHIQQKRKFRSLLYHRVTIVLLFVITILALHSTWKVYMKRKESIMMKETSSARLHELELRNEELEAKIKKLNTVSGVEEEIRSKFSVAKEEENMVIIVREENISSSTHVKDVSIWSKIKALFKKN